MPRRIAMTSLNASTMDIINTIRANASLEYQSLVPEVTKATDIPKVGEVLYGYPALANQFVSALVNRIALVKVNSATFNNAYKELKKGYLEFGETVEEVFVAISKVRTFNPEKGEQRELKRTLPDVKTAFHTMNWRVQYPITIQNEDLRMAFTSFNGVEDLIARIVDSVYTASEYDEFLLFKYLLIKAIAGGQLPIKIIENPTEATNKEEAYKSIASDFRGFSNAFTFLSDKFNTAKVKTATPKSDQYIFMSSLFNAQYDVEVLASAFNMDKADFQGRLLLIDDWSTFDNERFKEIISESDMIEEVTDDELELVKDVQAVLVDKEWFQVYDNLNIMTEKYVASGCYWNYFYNVWKIVSSSPFSNCLVFKYKNDSVDISDVTLTVIGKDESNDGITLTLSAESNSNNDEIIPQNFEFIQTEDLTEKGIAVKPYGAMIIPHSAVTEQITPTVALTYFKRESNTYMMETKLYYKLNAFSGSSATINTEYKLELNGGDN